MLPSVYWTHHPQMANRDNVSHKHFRGKAPGVVDMATFQRLKLEGAGWFRMMNALGCSNKIIGDLKKGLHWQQNPDKVRRINLERGLNIDPETGMPTEKDLAALGYASREAKAAPPAAPVESKPMPANLSSANFVELIESSLWHALQRITPENLDKASLRDLSTVTAMLIEKRQLLKGEPTVITRNDQRADLADFAKRLLGECQRRGIRLDLSQQPAMINVTPKETADA